MRKEKIVLSFVATLIGLAVAGVVFYFYETSKSIQQSGLKTVSTKPPSPTEAPSVFLTIDRPKDEEVVNQKIVTVSGKTTNSAVVAILTEGAERIVTPAANGDFSTTLPLNNGHNIIAIIAFARNAELVKLTKVVTYSTEEF